MKTLLRWCVLAPVIPLVALLFAWCWLCDWAGLVPDNPNEYLDPQDQRWP